MALDTILAQVNYTKYDKNGFIVNIYKAIDKKDAHYGQTFIGKGQNLKTMVGLTVDLEGFWQDDLSRGLQFSVKHESLHPINSDKSFITYLVSRYKGIGEATAKKLLAKFGPNYDVLLDEEQLKSCLTPKMVEKILSQSKTFDSSKEVYTLLSQADIFNNKKRIKASEILTCDEIYSDPFILQKKEYGKVSFSKINKLCVLKQTEPKIAKAFSSPIRIEEGVLYILTDMLFQRGHTWIDSNALIEETIKYLNADVENPKLYVKEVSIKKALNKLNREHKIKAEKFFDTLRIYNAFFYDSENFIAQEVVRRAFEKDDIIENQKIDAVVKTKELKYGIRLSDNQKLAIRGAVNNHICVITGSAGTGKTTVLKFAIETINSLRGGNIVLAAPTGRAARRMSESTGLDAVTLHHLLGISVEGDSIIPVATKEVDADYVFIDETSMCDIAIIYKLFQQCKDTTKFIFLGDPNQLPSVGAGNVLDDLIESQEIPVIKLKFIYRQSQQSNIVLNANSILNSSPVMKTADDFEIVNLNEVSKIKAKIVQKYQEELIRTNDIFETQIISPKRKDGSLSTYSLNKAIQEAVNPEKPGQVQLIANGFSFRPGDKIICCKNTQTVKNGDIGMVTSVSRNGDVYFMVAEFDTGEETFDADKVRELGFMLAHAITVHKSQGSEFRSVLMPIAGENRNMLKRNLFYTAITRAREKMIIVGTQQEIVNAVSNNKKYKRNTLLKARIRKYANDLRTAS